MNTSAYRQQNWIERLFWPTLAVYLFVLPIAHTTALRYLAFILLIIFTVALSLRQRTIPTLPFYPYWLVYFGVASISVAFAVDPAMSFSELRVEVVYWIVIFMIGVTWGKQLYDFRRLVIFLAVMNAVLTLSAFYYARLDMDFGTIMSIPKFAYAGMDGNWLLIAMFLIGWLIHQLWRSGGRSVPFILVLLLLLDIWAMMATQNRQNLIALGVGISVGAVLILRQRVTPQRFMLFSGLLLCVAALFLIQSTRRVEYVLPASTTEIATTATASEIAGSIGDSLSADVRPQLWAFSITKIAENPWIGGGIGRQVFDFLYPEFMPENGMLWHTHNMVLNKGIQMGIPGMLAFLWLWVALAIALLRHTSPSGNSQGLAIAGLAALAAIFAKNMTDDFFVRNVALFFWLVMGLLIGHLQKNIGLRLGNE